MEAQRLVEQLEGVVRGCRITLALLSPWDTLTALSQAWCLFEHMVALQARESMGLAGLVRPLGRGKAVAGAGAWTHGAPGGDRSIRWSWS